MKMRIALLSMVCGVLVLSGCGGSSRVSELEDRVNTAEPLVKELQAALDKAKEDRDAAVAAKEEAEAEQKEAEDRANTAARDAAAARDEAARDEAAREAAARDAEAAARAREEAEARRDEAEQATLNARAAKYIGQLFNQAGGNTIGQRGTATVDWMRGESLSVNPGGNFASGSGAPSISGFRPYSFTRRTGVEGNEMVYMYTNIQAPGTRAFWKRYGPDELMSSGNRDMARASGTARTDNSGTPDDMTDDKTRISGSFDGAGGTFECPGPAASCTVTVDTTTRQPTFTTGMWTFTPTNENNGVTVRRDDAYLYFGIWTREPDIASGEHDFEVIYGGGGETVSGILQTNSPLLRYGQLVGTATFTGSAIGKYVTRNQVGDNARIGTFNAQATFTANFAAESLDGRIVNFRDGSEELADWDVYLGSSATAAAEVENGSVSLKDGVTTARIGGVAATGNWTATVYGSQNTDVVSTMIGNSANPNHIPDSTSTRYPVADVAGVAGYFFASDNSSDASLANVAIGGAFAAAPGN